MKHATNRHIIHALAGLALASGLLLAADAASARTQAWYAQHLPEARTVQTQCMQRVQAGEKLAPPDREECERASGAVVHATTFVPSPAKSY